MTVMANRYDPAKTSSSLKLVPFPFGRRYINNPEISGVKKRTRSLSVMAALIPV